MLASVKCSPRLEDEQVLSASTIQAIILLAILAVWGKKSQEASALVEKLILIDTSNTSLGT